VAQNAADVLETELALRLDPLPQGRRRIVGVGRQLARDMQPTVGTMRKCVVPATA